jgi:putative ABC transport system substrate-binding protein
MQRREFLGVLSGTALAWPLTLRAQQVMPAIGLLTSLTPAVQAQHAASFSKGLGELNYAEGRNVAIEYRYAEGQYNRLPALAADLVRRQPAVIAAIGPPAALAAKAATSTIPIVFMTGLDPVRSGLVASMNRPDANVTGVFIFLLELGAKRLGLIRQLVPNTTLIGVMVNPTSPDVTAQLNGVQVAARGVGQQITFARATNDGEIDEAFVALAAQKVGALVVMSDPFFTTRCERIVALAASYRIPAMYELRDYTDAGGLMSYGTSLSDAYHQVGAYVGNILKGTKPVDMPVQQSSKVELIINLKTAKSLGLEFHPQLLAIADEVIE